MRSRNSSSWETRTHSIPDITSSPGIYLILSEYYTFITGRVKYRHWQPRYLPYDNVRTVMNICCTGWNNILLQHQRISKMSKPINVLMKERYYLWAFNIYCLYRLLYKFSLIVHKLSLYVEVWKVYLLVVINSWNKYIINTIRCIYGRCISINPPAE